MVKPIQWSGDNAPTPVNPPEVHVSKDSPVIIILGSLQELSASIGLARSLLRDCNLPEFESLLRETQRHLYIFKSDIASMSEEEIVNGKKIPRPSQREVQIIDENIKQLEISLGKKPDRFIIDCGAPAAAALFLANEVTRRTERLFISLQNALPSEFINLQPKIKLGQQYLNHLSYQLYLMARMTNRKLGIPEETIWTDAETGEVKISLEQE
jgi:ATP:cob(I)alamin adenosyltransferase